MVYKKKSLVNKNKFLAASLVLIAISFMVFVFAASSMTVPVAFGNYSTTLNISITVDGNGVNNMTNVTCWYNSTGESTVSTNGTFLTEIINITADQTVFENATINMSGFTDLRIYNISCEIRNYTAALFTTNTTLYAPNVTIDNTLPEVNATNFTTPVTLTNYSGSTVFNITVFDVTSNISSVVFNITNTSGTQVAAVTTSNSAGNDWDATFDTSSITEGSHNVTAIVTDYAGNVNNTAAILNVTLDGTPPAVTNFRNTVDGGNYDNSIVINVSVVDNGMGIHLVRFNITNSTGDQHNFTNASTPGGDYYNITLDTTVFTDGVYNITVYANDTELGNLNSTEVISVTFDNTAPSAITLTSSSATQTSLTITIAVTDATAGMNQSCTTDRSGASISGTTASQTLTETGLSCGTTTQYVVHCTDAAGNTGSSAQELFTTSACSSGGSSSGGVVTATWTNTYAISDEQFEQGYTKELGVKNRVKVRVTGSGGAIETHYVGVKEITETVATIEITSDPVEVKLEIGEDAKVDVTEDGYYDIYVKLNSITSGKADITVQKISEEIPEGEEAVTTTGEIVEEEEVPAVEEEKDLMWLWVLIGILILAAVIGGGVAVKKKQ